MARYLVTGGCGFIGSQLTKKLIEDKHEVIVLDDLSNGNNLHPDATLVKQDVVEYDVIRESFEGIDGCFHMAAVPTVVVEPDTWFGLHAINLKGSLNVFKAAMEAGNIPVVYASSCGVYGNATQLPLREDLFIQPVSAYGCDKLSCELNAFFVNHDYKLPVIGLRFFNVYGPFQQETSPYAGVITLFINNLLDGKPVTIFDDGDQTRDFIFVDDVVNNVKHAMDVVKQSADVVNLCTGNQTTINHLADTIASILDRECVKEYNPPRPFDARDSFGCQEKMHSYGFEANVDLRTGLAKTIEYFQGLRA